VPADAASLTTLRGHLLTAMGSDATAPDWAGRCEADLARRLDVSRR
jgi:hypothetical protein